MTDHIQMYELPQTNKTALMKRPDHFLPCWTKRLNGNLHEWLAIPCAGSAQGGSECGVRAELKRSFK